MRRILCLVCVVAFTGCRNETSKGVVPDRELVRYVPPNSTLLAGMDVEAVKRSGFYKRHANLIPQTRELAVDINKDISAVLLAWQNGEPLGMVRGNISDPKLQKQLQASNEKFARPKPDVLLFGAREVPAGDGIPAPLRARLDLLPRADQIWAASSQGLPLDRAPIRSDVQSALSNIVNNIRAFSVGVGLDEGVHLHSDLACDSEAGGKRVHDAMRGMIGMGRLMTRSDQMDLLKLYDAIQVDQDQATVRVHADLPAAQADRLVELLQEFRKR